jgi:hypothetical protein
MTEKQWLACKDPEPMLDFLALPGNGRKLRLFACACCRRVWDKITNSDCREAVETVEAFIDGKATGKKLSSVHLKVMGAKLKGLNSEAAYYVRGAISYNINDPRQRRKEFDPMVVSFPLALAASSWGSKKQIELSQQSLLLHDIFGNPFRPVALDPSWLTSTVTNLAQAIYDDRTFDRMPILADALEDAGCTDADILAHCRGGGEHVRGCWVVDLLLGKA